MEVLNNIPPVGQALVAGLFTWGLTALGAAMVFFFKEINKKVLNAMLGFAAGVMIAASFWSLLAPSIEMAEGGPVPPYAARFYGVWISFCRISIREQAMRRGFIPRGSAVCCWFWPSPSTISQKGWRSGSPLAGWPQAMST